MVQISSEVLLGPRLLSLRHYGCRPPPCSARTGPQLAALGEERMPPPCSARTGPQLVALGEERMPPPCPARMGPQSVALVEERTTTILPFSASSGMAPSVRVCTKKLAVPYMKRLLYGSKFPTT